MTEQVTDQRRREVAARLREGWSPYEATCTVLGRSETRGRWEGALADLVDRPTCAMEEFGDPEIHLDVRRQQCSRCHAIHLEQPNDRLRFRFCPVCGAEVVGR